MFVNFDLMKKGELQRMCIKLFKQFEDFKLLVFYSGYILDNKKHFM